MMTVIDRLNTKKLDLEERLSKLYSGGSQRRETLEYRIKKIDELINVYRTISPPANLSDAKEILNQQIGFTEQKRKILESIEIAEFKISKGIQNDSPILCLAGPTGTGKTTLARILAQALKKKFFSISLGGLSDASILIGASENLSGVEMGQLAKGLVETKSSDPLILLDEIDKAGSTFKTGIHDCLVSVLDPAQNQEILDHYLDVKLDFSRITFIVTANDLKKVPDYLRSRMTIIELPGYSVEQKKEIANKIIQKWFEKNTNLNRNNFEITLEALETLISKTKEKGVRQLKSALDSIFDYCLLQWSRETKKGEKESKISISPSLIHQIIPQEFPNIDQDNDQETPDNEEKKVDKKQLEALQKELEMLRKEKNNQQQLKAFKLNALLILRQTKEIFAAEEFHDYEEKINKSFSPEEIEIIEKGILLKIKQKSNPKKTGDDKNKSNKLTDLEKLISDLNKQLLNSQQLSADEIDKLKKIIQNLQKEKGKHLTTDQKNTWFSPFSMAFLFIIFLCGILLLKNYFKKWKKLRRMKKVKHL